MGGAGRRRLGLLHRRRPGSARGVPPRGCLGGLPGRATWRGPGSTHSCSTTPGSATRRATSILRRPSWSPPSAPRGEALGARRRARGTWAAAELPARHGLLRVRGDTFAAALALALGAATSSRRRWPAAGAPRPCLTGPRAMQPPALPHGPPRGGTDERVLEELELGGAAEPWERTRLPPRPMTPTRRGRDAALRGRGRGHSRVDAARRAPTVKSAGLPTRAAPRQAPGAGPTAIPTAHCASAASWSSPPSPTGRSARWRRPGSTCARCATRARPSIRSGRTPPPAGRGDPRGSGRHRARRSHGSFWGLVRPIVEDLEAAAAHLGEHVGRIETPIGPAAASPPCATRPTRPPSGAHDALGALDTQV